MRRIRIGIIGGDATCDWAVLPALSGPDISSPPDSGVWWGRRAAATADIAYQPPARVELVSLADSDVARLYRIAAAWRIRAPYADWRAMLREVTLDALVVVPARDDFTGSATRSELLAASANANLPLWWLDTPAATSHEAESLVPFAHAWCAHPLRAAAAHRAARRIIESGRIGAISSFALRWPRALQLNAHDADFAASYTAFDLMLWAASLPPRDAAPVTPHAARVALDENNGAASLWIRFAHGFEGRALTATALFATSDDWNSAAPRLEITGTQGRAVVCEGGRSAALLEPREAARILEVPGLAPHISHSNSLGIAEDLKMWLAHIAGSGGAALREVPAERSLANAATTLRLMEAGREALQSGALVETNLRRDTPPRALEGRSILIAAPVTTRSFQPTLRLPLEER
jgi:predicted dehydrogenase